MQDPNEPGLPGVTVLLQTCNGTMVRSTTTDASGQYSFSGLPAGSYRVVFVAPSGSTTYAISPANQGGDLSKDSDMDASGTTACISLSPFESRTDIDAGFIPGACPCVAVCLWVWPRVPGVPVWRRRLGRYVVEVGGSPVAVPLSPMLLLLAAGACRSCDPFAPQLRLRAPPLQPLPALQVAPSPPPAPAPFPSPLHPPLSPLGALPGPFGLLPAAYAVCGGGCIAAIAFHPRVAGRGRRRSKGQSVQTPEAAQKARPCQGRQCALLLPVVVSPAPFLPLQAAASATSCGRTSMGTACRTPTSRACRA